MKYLAHQNNCLGQFRIISLFFFYMYNKIEEPSVVPTHMNQVTVVRNKCSVDHAQIEAVHKPLVSLTSWVHEVRVRCLKTAIALLSPKTCVSVNVKLFAKIVVINSY